MNPNAAPTGKPAAYIVLECVANYYAVFFNACPTCHATLVNVDLCCILHFHPYYIYPSFV